MIQQLLEARAKKCENLCWYLGYEKTRLFAFEIYWPLIKVFFSDLNITLFKRKGGLPKHKKGFTSGNPVVSKAPLNRLRWKNNQLNNINIAARIQLIIAIFEIVLALFDATTYILHKCALNYLKLFLPSICRSKVII